MIGDGGRDVISVFQPGGKFLALHGIVYLGVQKPLQIGITQAEEAPFKVVLGKGDDEVSFGGVREAVNDG